MHRKKGIVSIVIVLMIFSAGALWAKGSQGATGSTEITELRMVLAGDRPDRFSAVSERLNEMLMEDISARVNIEHIGRTGDWRARYNLIVASGEAVDVMYVAGWLDFKGVAQRGPFRDLEPMLADYAPMSLATLPQAAFDEIQVNGVIYMLPCEFEEYSLRGWGVRGDLRKKYGVPEITSPEIFGQYLAAVKANNPDLIPYNAGAKDINEIANYLKYTLSSADTPLPSGIQMAYSMFDERNIYYLWDTPEFESWCRKAHEWYLAGFWPRNVLSNPGRSRDNFYNGTTSIAIIDNKEVNYFYNRVMDEHPEWEPEWYGWDNDRTVRVRVSPFIQNGLAVPVSAKNPEKGLMLIDLLRCDDRYNMLTFYGIEGEDYVLNSDGSIALPPGKVQADVLEPDSFPPWGWKMTRNVRIPANAWPGYADLWAYFKSFGYRPVLFGITLDTMDVQGEIAAMNQVLETHRSPLMWGVVETDEGLATLRQQMKAAGAQKVLSLVKEQVDDYLTEKNYHK